MRFCLQLKLFPQKNNFKIKDSPPLALLWNTAFKETSRQSAQGAFCKSCIFSCIRNKSFVIKLNTVMWYLIPQKDITERKVLCQRVLQIKEGFFYFFSTKKYVFRSILCAY